MINQVCVMRRLVLLLVLVMIVPSAMAFRCGTRLVSEGDHYGQVVDKCGEPDFEDKWVEDRVVFLRPHVNAVPIESLESVVIRLCTYNLGSRRFLRQLRFENGVLKKIETLKYGY